MTAFNDSRTKLSVDLKVVISGKIGHTFDEKSISKFINNACEKFVGKFGLAQLNPEISKIDQFTCSAIIRLT